MTPMDTGNRGIGRLDAESCYRAVKSRDRRFDGYGALTLAA